MGGLRLEAKREKEEKGGRHRTLQGIPREIPEPRLPLAEGENRARHRRRLLGQLRPARVRVRRHQERFEARAKIQGDEQGEGVPEPALGGLGHNEADGGRRQRHDGVLGQREILGAHPLHGPLQQFDRILRDKPDKGGSEDVHGGLGEAFEKKKEYAGLGMILHSDQGAVYSSKSFNELLPTYDITRSMSRAGTPTDNGAMEAINGWLKDELFSDFSLNESEDVEESVRAYVEYFNERRPAFALGYLTPKQFTEKFYGSWQGARKGEAAASGE